MKEEQRNSTQLGTAMLPEDFKDSLMKAREESDRQQAGDDIQYFRAYLKADRMIYAYEPDKQIMLQMLRDEAAKMGYEVLAFTLMDDELQLLLCRSRRSGRKTGGRKDLVRALHEEYTSYYRERHGAAASAFKEESGWKRIRKADVLSNCDEIHELPVKEHYVSHAKDFWWSSQNSYYGKYVWRFLNLWRIMSVISSDPAEAIRMYRDRQNAQRSDS